MTRLTPRAFTQGSNDAAEVMGSFQETAPRKTAENTVHKNSSGDEIVNVNFLTTISHTRRPTSKYRKRDKPTSFNKLDDR